MNEEATGILDPIQLDLPSNQTPEEPINTHNLKCDFGKHKDKLYTRIPVGYLKWMINEPGMFPERKAIARAELKRRGTIIPSLDISGHALDRASLRLLDRWKHREDQEQGLHAWLEGQAKEALRTGKESQPGKRIHNGVWFVFEMDGEWPVLKSVYPA